MQMLQGEDGSAIAGGKRECRGRSEWVAGRVRNFSVEEIIRKLTRVAHPTSTRRGRDWAQPTVRVFERWERERELVRTKMKRKEEHAQDRVANGGEHQREVSEL